MEIKKYGVTILFGLLTGVVLQAADKPNKLTTMQLEQIARDLKEVAYDNPAIRYKKFQEEFAALSQEQKTALINSNILPLGVYGHASLLISLLHLKDQEDFVNKALSLAGNFIINDYDKNVDMFDAQKKAPHFVIERFADDANGLEILNKLYASGAKKITGGEDIHEQVYWPLSAKPAFVKFLLQNNLIENLNALGGARGVYKPTYTILDWMVHPDNPARRDKNNALKVDQSIKLLRDYGAKTGAEVQKK